jgi:hypothetical protein
VLYQEKNLIDRGLPASGACLYDLFIHFVYTRVRFGCGQTCGSPGRPGNSEREEGKRTNFIVNCIFEIIIVG